MKTEHTQTPWKVLTDGCFIGTNDITIADTAISRRPEEARANSEFIVRAVNSHEALLKAAKIGLKWVEREQGNDHSESDFMKKAITLAEGQ